MSLIYSKATVRWFERYFGRDVLVQICVSVFSLQSETLVRLVFCLVLIFEFKIGTVLIWECFWSRWEPEIVPRDILPLTIEFLWIWVGVRSSYIRNTCGVICRTPRPYIGVELNWFTDLSKFASYIWNKCEVTYLLDVVECFAVPAVSP